ncbi:MAG: DUF4837 family protein [Paraprevotella sp.]|nr:DUF4837 family protein [Paraprevotella sp.]
MKRKLMELTGLWLVGILLLASCGNADKKTPLSPSQGLPGELLLVVDQSIWNTNARDSLEDVLKGGMPGLPQYEPIFRMMRLFPQDFSGKYALMRNILEVRMDPKANGVEMGAAYNVEAVPQTYVSIKAHDIAALNHFLMTKRDVITGLFTESELKWEAGRLKTKYSKLVDDASRKIFGYTVKVPSDIEKVKNAEHFIWASTDRLDQDMNYVCYSTPLADSTVWLSDRWVALRDSAMQRNIPGEKPDQWMTTTVESGKPLVMQRAVRLPDGKTVYEMRGLWEMHNGGIGGPFVSLAYPDSAHGRMLITEGFIYSPDSHKRDLVRRMEAALRTFSPVKR